MGISFEDLPFSNTVEKNGNLGSSSRFPMNCSKTLVKDLKKFIDTLYNSGPEAPTPEIGLPDPSDPVTGNFGGGARKL